MMDELKEEEIVNKVGGRFKLSTLIQKRLAALNTGAKALVQMRGEPMQIVLLALSVVVSVLTLAQGRALALQGLVHLTILAAFLFFSAVP